ncbi:MAG: ribonuclease Y [Bacillota bacterium]
MINTQTVLAGSVGLPAVMIIAVVVLAIGVVLGYGAYKILATRKIGEAKLQAQKILDDASLDAKSLKKEAILEAKEESLKQKNELDKEFRKKNGEIQKLEQRNLQKEDQLSKKEDNLDQKLNNVEQERKVLASKQAEVGRLQEKVNHAHEKMLEELETISRLTQEEARTLLIQEIESDAKKDAAVMVREIEKTAKDEAVKKAKNIVALSIQKVATEHASEITVSVVPLPNDDLKGRLIGREGRNIRALENATGIDLIIDDTPEVVILSGFDPVRREIARLSVERLISDGRIHPSRIEETVAKVKKEIEQEIKEAGEAAMFEVGIFGLHPEILRLLGKLKYRTSYGQNVLKHSIEVAHLAGCMASELDVDVTLAKRAGLLHDIGKAVDYEVEGTHIQIGTDLAKKYKENKAVVNAIEAHHGDVEPQTIEAILVQAADGISGARPGARRETLENYVKRLQKLEAIADEFKGVDKSFAISAGREVRVIVKPDAVSDQETIFMAKDIAKKIESELDYPGQIKVNVIRELRTVEFAK